MQRFTSYQLSDDQIKSYVDNVYCDLFSDDDGLPSDVKRLVHDALLPHYSRASLIAKSNQKTYRQAGLLVYTFSTLAVAAVAVGILFPGISVWAFAVELLLLLTILVTIIRANRKRAHKNWIEARYIAERIRATIFLTMCGVQTSQRVLPTSAGVTSKPDESMIDAFNELATQVPSFRPCHGQPTEQFLSFVRRAWLRPQIAFHDRVATDAEQKNVWLERIGIAVFSAAIVAAGMHLLLLRLHVVWLEHLLTFGAIVLPALGAAIGGVRTHREYSRLAVRSRNMALSLKALDDRLAKVTTPHELAALLTEVEELTLVELQDWLMLMSVAKLEAAA